MNYSYNSLNSLAAGLIALFIVCGGTVILAQALKIKLPEKIRGFLLGVGGFSMIIAGAAIIFGDWRLREELREIPPQKVTNLTLSKDGVKKQIIDPSDVLELMSQIQSIKYIMAHHSVPKDEFDISFSYDGQQFHYRFGRDSDQTNEYWVFNERVSETEEIGRIKSGEFGPMIDKLLTTK